MYIQITYKKLTIALNLIIVIAILIWLPKPKPQLQFFILAVTTCPSNFSLISHLKESHPTFVNCEDLKIFLFVGGIRPVKNPLYLIKAFEGNVVLSTLIALLIHVLGLMAIGVMQFYSDEM